MRAYKIRYKLIITVLTKKPEIETDVALRTEELAENYDVTPIPTVMV
jgi:thioredoxin-related protein